MKDAEADEARRASKRAGPPSQTLLTSRRLITFQRPLATSAVSFAFQEDRASSSSSEERARVPEKLRTKFDQHYK